MAHPDYPGATSYSDRHGKIRWRFRAGKRTVSLPGNPGDAAFDRAYADAVRGRPAAKVTQLHPLAPLPQSLAAAWAIVRKSAEWQMLAPGTRAWQSGLAEDFLSSPVAPGAPLKWGSCPVADLRRRHVKAIIEASIDRPHRAKHLVTLIRKMIDAAIDAEWIENDPTIRLRFNPRTRGHRAWTMDECARYLARWPAGSRQRLAFMLALFLGNRRSDVARLQWRQRVTRAIVIDGQSRIAAGFEIEQKKTGAKLFVPESPALTAELALAPRVCETVLATAFGKPFSEKSLGGRMKDWRALAGLPADCVMHGLRKTLGKLLAEHGATTREAMDVLGHADIKHAELYSRDAEQVRLAIRAMDRIAHLFTDGEPLGEPVGEPPRKGLKS